VGQEIMHFYQGVGGSDKIILTAGEGLRFSQS